MPVLIHFTYSQLCIFFSDKMSQLYLCGQQSYLPLAPHPPCSQKHVLIFLFYTERDIARNCLGMQNILCIVHHDSSVKTQHWGRVEVGRVLSTTEVSQRICDNLKSLWLCPGGFGFGPWTVSPFTPAAKSEVSYSTVLTRKPFWSSAFLAS